MNVKMLESSKKYGVQSNGFRMLNKVNGDFFDVSQTYVPNGK